MRRVAHQALGHRSSRLRCLRGRPRRSPVRTPYGPAGRTALCARKPVGSAHGGGLPTSRCSTTSSRRRPVAATSSFVRSCGSSRAAALPSSSNRISGGTPACLFNSFNFDFARLRRFARDDCRMVHRVDGPIGVVPRLRRRHRSRAIAELNAELADATVLQSRYSLEKHVELGIDLRDPVVISNTVDPAIFHPPRPRGTVAAAAASRSPRAGRTIHGRAPMRSAGSTGISTLLVYERHVRRADVGAASSESGIVGPLDSDGVARLLREHDVYLAASRDDPCSNALLEALACGLPAAYLMSGGHPELVGEVDFRSRRRRMLPDGARAARRRTRRCIAPRSPFRRSQTWRTTTCRCSGSLTSTRL